MRLKTALPVALCAALVLGVSETAVADAEKAARPANAKLKNLTIVPGATPDRTKFKGRVASDVKRCARNRRIRIEHDGVIIAGTKTEEDGFFVVLGPQPPSGDTVIFHVLEKKRGCAGATKSTTAP